MPASTGEYLAQFLWNEILFALQGRCKNDELTVRVNETPKSTASYDG
jgi:hypothetical protein